MQVTDQACDAPENASSDTKASAKKNLREVSKINHEGIPKWVREKPCAPRRVKLATGATRSRAHASQALRFKMHPRKNQAARAGRRQLAEAADQATRRKLPASYQA